MNYHLTTMTAEHIPQIAQLERTCFSHPWSEELLLQELWNDASAVIVAEGENGTVLGYAGVNTVLDEGYINNVAVAPQFRRQGVADELIAALVRFGRAKLAFLTLDGFQQAGRRKHYYDDPREDAIIMTLEFDHETESAEQGTTDGPVPHRDGV